MSTTSSTSSSPDTKVFIDEFKGHRIFAIWAIDEEGNKKGKAPLVSFGVKKAQSILTYMDELKNFVSENK